MALINCPECYKSVSDKSTACINCGFPISSKLSPFKHTPPPLPSSDFTENEPRLVVTKSKPSKAPDFIAGLFIILFIVYQLATCSENEPQEPSLVQNSSSDSGFTQIPMSLSGSSQDGRYFLTSHITASNLEDIEYMRKGNENDAYGKMQINCSNNEIRKTSSESPESLQLADLGEWYTPTPDWTDKDIFNFICN